MRVFCYLAVSGTINNNTMPIAERPKDNPLEGLKLTREQIELFAGDISYDLIRGGVARGFKSEGIDDQAKKTQLTVTDGGIEVAGSFRATNASLQALTVRQLEVEEFNVTGILNTKVHVKGYTIDNRDLTLSAGAKNRETLHNSGILWGEVGPRLTFDRFKNKLVLTGGIDFDSGSEITINGKQVLTETALGKNIKSSGLTRLGVLDQLEVDGPASFDGVYVNSIIIGLESEARQAITATEDKISWGLGELKDQLVLKIDQPKGIALQQGDDVVAVFDADASVVESDLVVNGQAVANRDLAVKGNLGVAKDLVVGAGARVTSEGAAKFASVQIGANTISWADVKPEFGKFNTGDIVFCSQPEVGKAAGWICVKGGEPGTWAILALAI